MEFTRRQTALFMLFGIGLIGVMYFPGFGARLFVLDDLMTLMQPQISSPLTWASLKTIFTPGVAPDFYPIRDLSYVLDFSLFGANQTAFRLHGLLLFSVIIVLLYCIWRSLGATRALAAAGSVLWGALPVHVEMVHWITARKDLLALLFGCASVLTILKLREELPRKLTRKLQALAIVFFILSLLSKASLVLLPFAGVIGGWWAWKKNRSIRTVLLVACAISVAFSLATRSYYSSINDMQMDYSPEYRLQASVTAFGKMLLGWILPSKNIVDVENWGSWLEVNHPYFGPGVVAWGVILLVIAVAWERRSKLGLSWAALFLFLYFPVSGLVFSHRNFYSVRYLEPVLAVTIVCTGLVLDRYRHRFIQIYPVYLAVLIFSLHSTLAEVRIWTTPLSVVEKGLSQNPDLVSLNALKFAELVRLSKDFPNESWYLALKSEWVAKLSPLCRQPKDSDALTCAGFWSTMLSETPAANADVREKLLPLAIEPLKKNARTLPWALTAELGYRFSLGNAEMPLVQEWYSKRKGLITIQLRVLNWAATCLLKSPDEARALLRGYEQAVLMPPHVGEKFAREYVHARYRSQLETCL